MPNALHKLVDKSVLSCDCVYAMSFYNPLFIYRPNEKGFDDWVSDMPSARAIIISYESEWDSLAKFREHEKYTRAKAYYDKYLEFKRSLNELLALHLKYKLKNGSWRYDFIAQIKCQLVNCWLAFECPNRQSRLKRISNEEIGKEKKMQEN